MSNKLQIPRPFRVVHDAVNIHLNNFEKTHWDHFSYYCVKEGFHIERFELSLERRPYSSEYRDRDAPSLGWMRIRPLGTSLTEMVIEDSGLLEIGPEAFLSSDVRFWDDEEDDEEERPSVTLKERRARAAATFERFKTIHEDVRESVIKGLRDDQLLLGRTKVKSKDVHPTYVDKSRIAELRQLRSLSFDITRLVLLCEELNKCFRANAYCATAALVRAVIDHVPPVFGVRSFAEVANNIGEKSTKASLLRLENSSRNIADSVLHHRIRKREVVPNRTQVNFSQELDVLLAEIIRRLS